MSFSTELAKSRYQFNLVLKIGAKYYSTYTPDSGLTPDYVGYISKVSINGANIELLDAKTTISTCNFNLVDKSNNVSLEIANSTNQWIGETVELYLGFIGSFPWSDYQLISTTYIQNYSRVPNEYQFKSHDPLTLLNKPIYTLWATVNNVLSVAETSEAFVQGDIVDFPSSGDIVMDDEFIHYTGKSLIGGAPVAYNLTGMTRGYWSSVDAEHEEGTKAYVVYSLSSNPLTLLLTILSVNLGIDSSLIDTAGIEAIRDGYFASEVYTFKVWDIQSALDFIEKHILIPTNTRLIIKSGKISLALLGQITYEATEVQFNEDHLVGMPSYSIDGNRVVNVIEVEYDYDYILEKYLTTVRYKDDASIALYGESKPVTIEMLGVTTANGGAAIAQDRAERLLDRLSNPTAKISCTTLFNRLENDIGSDVRFIHRFLPGGSGLGADYLLEILSKAPDYDKGTIKWELSFTSYSTLRIALISPAKAPSSVTSQKVFTMPTGYGQYYEAGYYLKLEGFADAANPIASVNGDEITMTNSFTNLSTSSVVTFADYDSCPSAQTLRWGFVGYDTGFFGDGKKSYEIIL